MLRLLHLIFLLFIFTIVKSQPCVTLTGRVTDTASSPLHSVIISVSTEGKKYFAVSDSKGMYTVKYCYPKELQALPTANISYKLIGYIDKDTSIIPALGLNVLTDMKLLYSIKQLNEVIVNNKTITQKGDTTSFMLSRFKNKMDANLEDVLKRMPGFDVDESGKILYDNKPIETILIEGDELAKNYKLISKNIPPDAIDKVEMIDKYDPNVLLKGLSGSRKQAMNLTLKNPKHISTFGNIKAGAGIEEKFNFSGNLFGINKQFKSMLLANANNIGVNPYEEISFDQRTIQSKDYEFDNTLIQNQIFENPLFSRPLFNNVSNNLFNNSKMATINGSLRISDKWSAKLFSDTYSDILRQQQFFDFNNHIYPALSYTTTTQKKFLPQAANIFFQLKFLNSKHQFLLSATVNNKKYIEQDSITSFINYLSGHNSAFNRKGIAAYYTNRIDSSHLVELSLQYYHDFKNQNYSIQQNAFRNIDTSYTADYFMQQTFTGLDYLKAEARYLFKKKKSAPSEIRITNNFFNTSVSSDLLLRNGNIPSSPIDFINDNHIKSNKLQILGTKNFFFKKISAGISGGGAIFSNRYHFSTGQKISSSSILPVINLNIKYKLGKYSDISYSCDYNSAFPGILTVSHNPVLNSFRAFTRRVPWERNIPYLQSSLTYLYKNINTGTSFIAAWIYQNQKNSEISNIHFTRDFDFYTTRFSDVNQDQQTLFFKFDKYISRLKTSFNIKQSFNWFLRPIELNNKILSNRNFAYSTTISFRPTISNGLSLTSGININYNKDIQSLKSTYQTGPFLNTLAGISEKISLGVNCAFYTDNYSFSKNSYWFAGTYIWYTAKKTGIDMKLTVNNIFSTDRVLTGSRNEIATQYSAQTILPRFAILEFTYKF